MNEWSTQRGPCSWKSVHQLFFFSFKLIFLSGASHVRCAMCALSKRIETEFLFIFRSLGKVQALSFPRPASLNAESARSPSF